MTGLRSTLYICTLCTLIIIIYYDRLQRVLAYAAEISVRILLLDNTSKTIELSDTIFLFDNVLYKYSIDMV